MAKIGGEKARIYWADVCIASAQVFLGIAAAMLFTSPSLDVGKSFVICLNVILAMGIFLVGWRLIQ